MAPGASGGGRAGCRQGGRPGQWCGRHGCPLGSLINLMSARSQGAQLEACSLTGWLAGWRGERPASRWLARERMFGPRVELAQARPRLGHFNHAPGPNPLAKSGPMQRGPTGAASSSSSSGRLADSPPRCLCNSTAAKGASKTRSARPNLMDGPALPAAASCGRHSKRAGQVHDPVVVVVVVVVTALLLAH